MSEKTDLVKYLPLELKKIEEITEFLRATAPEFDEARYLKEHWLANRFPWQAQEDGLRVWEKILQIKPNTSDSIENRRIRVIAKLNERTPYTFRQLWMMMAAICGVDGFDLKLEHFMLMVTLSMESHEKLDAVMEMLSDVLPMHIYVAVTQLIEFTACVCVAGAVFNELEITILPEQIQSVTVGNELYLGGASHVELEVTVGP